MSLYTGVNFRVGSLGYVAYAAQTANLLPNYSDQGDSYSATVSGGGGTWTSRQNGASGAALWDAPLSSSGAQAAIGTTDGGASDQAVVIIAIQPVGLPVCSVVPAITVVARQALLP